MMTKKMVPALFLALCCVLATGCGSLSSTWLGRHDRSVPRTEQSLLGITQYFTVTKFDGEKVSWKRGMGSTAYVSVPSGDHEITFDYYNKFLVSSTMSTNTYRVKSVKDVRFTAYFTDGVRYKLVLLNEAALLMGFGSSMEVAIQAIRDDQKNPAYTGGNYSGVSFDSYIGLASSSMSTLGLGVSVPFGYEYDGPVHWGFFLEGGGEVGTLWPNQKTLGIGIGAYAGGFGKIYIPGTPAGIIAGGGLRQEAAFVSGTGASLTYIRTPYARGGLLLGNKTPMLLYGDYYFDTDPKQLFPGSSSTASNPAKIVVDRKQWGAGILWSF